MKRAGLVFFLGLGLVCASSCSGNEEVTLILLDPCAGDGGVGSFRKAAAYTEIFVVKDRCPDDADLAAGKVEGVVYEGIAPADEAPPTIGALDKGQYGFVVLLKDANCGVIGFGCTAADMENIREVRIAVRAWTSSNTCQPLSGGSCPLPLLCDEGRCVKEVSEGGPGGCDLTVVNGGPLPEVLGTGSQVTGPGVVATNSGFVIGYREIEADGTVNATLVPLTDAGALGSVAREPVTGCAGRARRRHRYGAANGEGLMAMSLPDCGDGLGAGASFIPFDGAGAPGAKTSPKNAGFTDLTLARHGSIAPATQPGEWEFVYRAATTGGAKVDRAFVRGNSLLTNPGPVLLFDGASDAQVTSRARAFIGPATRSRREHDGQLSKAGQPGDTATIAGEPPRQRRGSRTAWNDRVAVGVAGASGLQWLAASVTATAVNPVVSTAAIG
jgi:hypothetical protein